MEHKKECKGVWKVHRRCTEGMEGCTKVQKGTQVVAPGDSIVGRWCGWCGCRPSAQKIENFRMHACFDRAYHEKSTWSRLREVWWWWHKARRCVGGVPVELEGSGSPGGWWRTRTAAHAHAKKSKSRQGLNEKME